MKFINIEDKHKKDFEDFVNNRRETTCMQMWEWTEARNKEESSNYKRVGVIDDNGNFNLAATYTIFSYRSFCSVIYIPQGPIWGKEEALKLFINEIKRIGKENNCFVIVCEPRVRKQSDRFKQLITNGFKSTKKAVQPRETVFVDLTKSEEEILASFSKNTRYNIHYAQRKGITIKKYTSPSGKSRIEDFYKILQLTKERKYFKVQSLEYFKDLWEEFSKSTKVTLYEAWYKYELLHSLIVLNNNIWAGSLASGSSRKFSNLKATYLARWESIKDAKRKGCKIYDFFGATKSKDENHPFFHTTQFKVGFGRTVEEFSGTFEIVLNPIKYYTWRLLERLGLFKFYEDSFLKEFRKKHASSTKR